MVVLAPLTVTALVGCNLKIHGGLFPSFPYQPICNSVVDTWDSSAWIALVALDAVVLVSLIFLPFTRYRFTLWMTVSTLALALAAGIPVYRNHAVLSERATALTGRTKTSWLAIAAAKHFA